NGEDSGHRNQGTPLDGAPGCRARLVAGTGFKECGGGRQAQPKRSRTRDEFSARYVVVPGLGAQVVQAVSHAFSSSCLCGQSMMTGRRGQGGEDFARRRDPAELGGNAAQRGSVQLAIVRRDGIRDDDGWVTRMEGAMNRVFDADLSDGAGDDQGLDALRLEDLGQDGVVEGAVSVLVDDMVTGRDR